MRLHRGWKPITLALLLCVLLWSGPLGAEEPPAEPPPTPVFAAHAEEKDATPVIELVGTSTANRTSLVAAEVGGIVKSVNFNQGDQVKQGDVLVELDQGNLELALKAAQARATGAKVKLEEARRELARSASLKASNAIAVQKYEQDMFQVQNLEQALTAAEAEAGQLSDRIGRMTVRAPFDGFIVDKHTEVGQWLAPGAPVATLIDLATIKVAAPLPERYLTWVKVGAEAEVVVDALGDKVFPGRVTALVPLAEEKTRNLPLEVSLENPGLEIKAGLLARVRIKGPSRKVLVAPKDALVLSEHGAVVFVVKGAAAFPVPVTTGRAYDGEIEITGDIAPGQLVVVQGNERLRPGQKV
ncbi:MAG: efflux RND transporter periplasmic adaptor subunit, partial [Thermodesulfobacteriota bacterium]